MVARKVTSIFLLAFFLSLFFGSVVAAPVEVRIAAWAPGTTTGDILAEYIAEFNAVQDEVKVVHEAYQGEAPLIVSYTAGTAPDIAILKGPAPLSYGGQDGMFLPLDEFIDGPNGFARDTFVPDMWSFTTVDGKSYGIAIDTNERALFVNKALAENSGLSTRNSVSDWDDLLAWAKKMTLKNGEETQRWGFWTNFDGTGGTMWHWIWLNDGKLFNADGTKAEVDNPNTIQAIEYLSDMVNVYGVAPSHGGNGRTPFLNNDLGMIITHSGLIRLLDESEMSFMTIPGPPGNGKEGGRFSGATDSVLTILDSTDHADEAWKFVRWLSLEKGLEMANRRSLIPFLRQGLQNERFQQQPWKAFAESIMTYHPENYYRARVSSRHWWSGKGLLRDTITAVIKKEAPAESTLQEVAKVVTATLQSVQEDN